jgi:C4-dicarboxylate transporter DctM subunit
MSGSVNAPLYVSYQGDRKVSPETIGIIGLIIMLVLMFLRVPLGLVLIMVGFGCFAWISGIDQGLSILGSSAFRTSSGYMLLVMPLFILMGSLASYAGLALDAFYAANKWIGHFRGGLAMATVCGCTAFGAVCGSSIATAATMCTVALPEMRRYGYKDQFSLGTICSGGLLGFMIPPSTAFIIYGICTQESIGRLFIAGIMPGLLIAFLFIIAISIWCRINPSLAPASPKVSWRERWGSLYKIWGVIALFILVMGGLYGGIFTPNEAAAVGAFGALVLGLLKRQMTWKIFTKSLNETGQLTGMIFFLIIGANIFNVFIAMSKIPLAIATFIGGLDLPPILIVIALVILYIILGFFMELISIILISMPIIYPLLVTVGIDPIWFGVLVVLTIMIGQITPPVGVVVYAIGGMVRDVPLFTIFNGTWPFLYAQILAAIILIAFPEISVWLPNLMMPIK